MTASRILIVDDEPDIRKDLVRWLDDAGYRTEQAANAEEAETALLRNSNFNVILLDLRLPDIDGFTLLKKLHREYPDICIIVLTGFEKEYPPDKARAAGAFDFFPKPIHFESLILRIKTAINQFKEKREKDYQNEEAKRQFQIENIIGNSPAMLRVFDVIQRVAETNETVLIQGENGTGKDLIAGAIHYKSLRRNKPFIVSDCAALPENLAETELFGHEKGAFTGATSRKLGKFERADMTTLFVNEIGELSPQLQMKFLRFLQDKTFERVGGMEPIEVDVRIIVATNKNLPEAIKQERFREDLFHRISRVVITVPPLRERRSDILPLVNHFIKTNNRLNGKSIEGISRPALALLENYHFPGNVRELENLIASAMLFEDGKMIQPETLRIRLMPPVPNTPTDFKGMKYRAAKKIFERQYFTLLLEQTNGKISPAARLAGLDRSHFRSKLKDLGIITGHEPEDET
jgi:DNA-binding NtrC family response regulator